MYFWRCVVRKSAVTSKMPAWFRVPPLGPLEYCSLYHLQNPLRKKREFMERIANEMVKFPPNFYAETSGFERRFQQPSRFRALPLTTSWVMLHSINFVQLIITACGANVNSLWVGKCQWGGVSAMNVCVFCMTSCRVARSCKTSPVSREWLAFS